MPIYGKPVIKDKADIKNLLANSYLSQKMEEKRNDAII